MGASAKASRGNQWQLYGIEKVKNGDIKRAAKTGAAYLMACVLARPSFPPSLFSVHDTLAYPLTYATHSASGLSLMKACILVQHDLFSHLSQLR